MEAETWNVKIVFERQAVDANKEASSEASVVKAVRNFRKQCQREWSIKVNDESTSQRNEEKRFRDGAAAEMLFPLRRSLRLGGKIHPLVLPVS